MRDASTLEYDRRDADRTALALDMLLIERDALALIFDAAPEADKDRLGLALDQCSDAIGALQDRLHETEYEIGLFGGGWR